MKIDWVIIWAVSVIITSCFKVGVTNKASISTFAARDLELASSSSESEVFVAELKVNTEANQTLRAGIGNSLNGASVTFPPGSLSIDTAITMQEAASIATSAFTSELNLKTTVDQTGLAVSFKSEVPMDAKTPFTLNVPLPIQTRLLADQWQNLVVMFRIIRAADSKVISGIIPREDIVVENGSARISSNYFGSFQAAVVSVAINDRVQVESKAVVLTKKDVANLPPLNILARTPFVLKANETIEVNGFNFRSTMLVASNGQKVKGLKILSDTSATFIVPENTPLGLSEILFDQDGVALKISIYYKGMKTDFPVMTRSESEVCAGEKYYNASGDLKVGSRICNILAECTVEGQTNCIANSNAPAVLKTNLANRIIIGETVVGVAGSASNRPNDCVTDGSSQCVVDGVVTKSAKMSNFIDSDIRSTVVIAGIAGILTGAPPGCNSDGQTGCLSNASFPAVDKASLTANASKIRSGTTIANVSGSLGNCVSDGSAGCVVVGPAQAAATIAGAAAKILVGQTLAGVSGNAPIKPADCSSDGQINCVAVIGFKAANVASFDAWDVRTGKTIAGVSGQISFFKNLAKISTFDRTTGAGAQVGVDPYDTLYDISVTVAADVPLGFLPNSGQAWLRDPFSDNGTGGGTSNDGTCDATEDCVYIDRISKMYWAKGTKLNYSWEDGITYCDQLVYGGYSDWRLPTQKEFFQAYIDGINFIRAKLNFNMALHLTSTTRSDQTFIPVHTGEGYSPYANKTDSMNVLCSR